MPRDPKLDPVALDLMARSRLADLRSEADELAALVREVRRPLPVLPTNPTEREMVLMALLLQARNRARRLLALVARVM